MTSHPGGHDYDGIGATRAWRDLPEGYGRLRVRRRVGGRDRFEEAARFVLGLGMQRGSGLQVPEVEVVPGADVLMRLGRGRLSVTVPTRVVYVVAEPDRRGFAYGTLPGHPERGEELFLVERDAASTYAEVRAFSRPGRWPVRLAGPLAPLAQRALARHYLRVLERALR